MKGGVLGDLEERFAGDFGADARREWAVLPRNSAVFGLDEGAAWRFSARRTAAGWLGEKIFKKGGEKGEKPKIGVREVPEDGAGAPYIGRAG